MMLADDLLRQVRFFIGGEISLLDLHRWMSDHDEALEEVEDEGVFDLSERIWCLLAERAYGHRTEDGVRDALASQLEENHVEGNL